MKPIQLRKPLVAINCTTSSAHFLRRLAWSHSKMTNEVTMAVPGGHEGI